MSRATPSDTRMRAWGLFLYSHSLLLERIESELSAAQLPALGWYDLLWELEKVPDGKLRMHELADRIVLPRYNLTRLADRLVEARLIEREDCPDDRRGYFLVITGAGRRMRKRMWEVYEPLIEECFTAHLTEAQALAMVDGLAQVARAIRESGDSGIEGAKRKRRK